jgi:hypothetical protein
VSEKETGFLQPELDVARLKKPGFCLPMICIMAKCAAACFNGQACGVFVLMFYS